MVERAIQPGAHQVHLELGFKHRLETLDLLFSTLGMLLTSFVGNFERDDAAGFLKHFSDVLTQSDKLLIGLDGCCDPSKV